MEAFTRKTGIAVPIEGLNVDTDQIIPARFLKFDRAAGYGQFLFHDLRFDEQGAARGDFILNREPYRRASILVADENFGCGSSREGAVYALHDFGIRVVIAPRFGDIFYNNCLRNGLLPAIVSATDAQAMRMALAAASEPRLTVDLEAQRIAGVGIDAQFALDAFWRECLLQGVDEIGLALRMQPAIEAFERDYFRSAPWLVRHGA
jgi:3-isopropylmalate/(R)-2-methylmalate dehydratase small subunit